MTNKAARKKLEEIWKDIPNYEGYYQISNLGNVRSLDRVVKDNTRERIQKLKGKLLKICDNGKGYKLVYLTKNSERKNFYIHRLVAENFIVNPNDLEEVNHKDLNKNNNIVTNLEWVTEIQNKRHYRNTNIAKKNDELRAKNRIVNYRKQIENKIPIIIEMYTKFNATITEINYKTGIGKAYISKILKENNIPINNKKRNPVHLTRDKLGRFAKKEGKHEKK